MEANETFLTELAEKFSNSETFSQDVALSIITDTLKQYSIKFASLNKNRTEDTAELPFEAQQYLTSLEIENYSKATIKNRKLFLKLFFEAVQKPLKEIDSFDLRQFLYNYKTERGISDRSLETVRIGISAFFTWLMNNDFIDKNPSRKIRPIKYEAKQRKALTRYDLEILRIEAAKDPFTLALIDFIFSTGCRVSEVCNVKTTDIDWNNKSLKIIGKGKKERTVYLNDRAIISLKLYLENRKNKPCEFLFGTRRAPYHQMTPGNIQKIMHELESRCKLSTHLTPHILRHTFATLALQSGMPLEQIQVAMGHTSIDTTRVYAELADEEIKRNHSKFII